MEHITNETDNSVLQDNKENFPKNAVMSKSKATLTNLKDKSSNDVRQTLKIINALHPIFDGNETVIDGTNLGVITDLLGVCNSSTVNRNTLKRKSKASSSINSLHSKSVEKMSDSRKSKKSSLTLNVDPLKPLASTIRIEKRQTMWSTTPHQNNVVQSEDNEACELGNSKKFIEPLGKFPCNFCDKSFFVKTTLTHHQKSHIGINSNCPYCRRAFDKPIALKKHLRENCSKISIAERKKLLADDEKYVEKTQNLNVNSSKPRGFGAISPKAKDLLHFVATSSRSARNMLLTTPSKMVPTITGIYQIPRKAIKCECGARFTDAVSFATHVEAEHSQ